MALASLGFSLSANTKATITLFDVPGADFGTYPSSISDGAIVGWWADSSFAFHGFLRASDGTITAFDPARSTNTAPTTIKNGAIAGYFYAANVWHGFLRAADGTITKF